MSRKGKDFEKTIRLIQETLNESPDTKIYNNIRVENQTGRSREIDIAIVSKINDFQIFIAIECKDYSRKVPVKEIEAFNSKCDLIKAISKRVFISSSGYQKGAIESAKAYGIELLRTEDLTSESVMEWMPIKKLGMRFITPFRGPELFMASENQVAFFRDQVCMFHLA